MRRDTNDMYFVAKKDVIMLGYNEFFVISRSGRRMEIYNRVTKEYRDTTKEAMRIWLRDMHKIGLEKACICNLVECMLNTDRAYLEGSGYNIDASFSTYDEAIRWCDEYGR